MELRSILDVEEKYLTKWKSYLSVISDFYQSSIGVICKYENGNSKLLQYHFIDENINLQLEQEFIPNYLNDEINLLSENSFVLKSYNDEQKFGTIKFCSFMAVPVYYFAKEIFGHIFLFDINKEAFSEKTVKLVFQTKELIENDLLEIKGLTNNKTELIEAGQNVLIKNQDLLEYERIFNLVANPICIVGIDGIFIKTNPAFQRILGYSSQDIEGHSMYEMIHPDDLQRSISYVNEIIKEQPDLLEFENRYICKDGSFVWFSWMVQPVYEKGISYSVAHDITKLKHTEEELSKAKLRAEESDRLKTAFLCNMSHEIRTPMNGIVGFSDLLKSSAAGNEELSYYCDIIRTSGQQLLRIVNDIIDISKIEIGEFDIVNNTVNINDLITNVSAFYNPDLIGKRLKIEVETVLEHNNAFFSCDETKLRQILDNLISNAIKFTEKGVVKISYKLADGTLTISVQDSGIGIPEDKRENIFERFAQLKNSNKSYGGAGLGLAICKAYIHKMGGDIWVDSEIGRGSNFKFTLPFIQK